ncbi:hypothetical protein [Pseudomonas phage Astolliot]|nr:hypothetical protein [Pseudomonas phage Astolliot]
MKSVAIELDMETNDPVEALKACARQIRDGYGAGSLVTSDAQGFNDKWLGFWTSIPKSWEGTKFKADILIESETELSDYDMAALVESRIKEFV